MGTVEGGVGNLGGMERLFHHGGLQLRKKKFGFSKKRLISFEKG
jgi:hypothetical protein